MDWSEENEIILNAQLLSDSQPTKDTENDVDLIELMLQKFDEENCSSLPKEPSTESFKEEIIMTETPKNEISQEIIEPCIDIQNVSEINQSDERVDCVIDEAKIKSPTGEEKEQISDAFKQMKITKAERRRTSFLGNARTSQTDLLQNNAPAPDPNAAASLSRGNSNSNLNSNVSAKSPLSSSGPVGQINPGLAPSVVAKSAAEEKKKKKKKGGLASIRKFFGSSGIIAFRL
jgi:hypothetical protein